MATWWDRLSGGKRWGRDSTLDVPTDAQANQGFNYLGQATPTAGLHDALFQFKDDADIWLFNQLKKVMAGGGQTPSEFSDAELANALNSMYGWGRFINVQTFTANGTYTPTSGMKICVIEAQGGGGAGGGCSGAGAGNVSLGAPGLSGAYAKGLFLAAVIGASKPVTIGAGGTPFAGATGGTGGTTSVGALISAPGGIGGGTLTNQVPPTVNGNGAHSTAPSGGNIVSSKGSASAVTTALSNNAGFAAPGGASLFGPGGFATSMNVNGVAAVNYGAGGSGTLVNNAGGIATGGAGFQGIVIIWEFA